MTFATLKLRPPKGRRGRDTYASGRVLDIGPSSITLEITTYPNEVPGRPTPSPVTKRHVFDRSRVRSSSPTLAEIEQKMEVADG